MLRLIMKLFKKNSEPASLSFLPVSRAPVLFGTNDTDELA